MFGGATISIASRRKNATVRSDEERGETLNSRAERSRTGREAGQRVEARREGETLKSEGKRGDAKQQGDARWNEEELTTAEQRWESEREEKQISEETRKTRGSEDLERREGESEQHRVEMLSGAAFDGCMVCVGQDRTRRMQLGRRSMRSRRLFEE